MTTRASRPASAASIACRWPARRASNPNASRATRSIRSIMRRGLPARPGGETATGLGCPTVNTEWAGRKLHFVGIGGAGMSGLALVAGALGAAVTGSDRAPGSAYAGTLRAAGIEPRDRPRRRERARRREVVVSSAIPPENPERAAARERGLRELHRADLLGELTRLRPRSPSRARMADDDVEHARPRPARLRHGPRLPRRRRGAVDRRQRRLGRGGVARRRGRRVRTAHCSSSRPGSPS
jgi:hypothetical protein